MAESSAADLAAIVEKAMAKQLGERYSSGRDLAKDLRGQVYEMVSEGRSDGEIVGVPFRVSLKSLVWYRPSVLECGWSFPPRPSTFRIN